MRHVCVSFLWILFFANSSSQFGLLSERGETAKARFLGCFQKIHVGQAVWSDSKYMHLHLHASTDTVHEKDLKGPAISMWLRRLTEAGGWVKQDLHPGHHILFL